MNELVYYLGRLEERIRFLDEENQRLRALPAPAHQGASNVDERTIDKYVASSRQLTNIVHPSFLKQSEIRS
jgi:hypothetical protein